MIRLYFSRKRKKSNLCTRYLYNLLLRNRMEEIKQKLKCFPTINSYLKKIQMILHRNNKYNANFE